MCIRDSHCLGDPEPNVGCASDECRLRVRSDEPRQRFGGRGSVETPAFALQGERLGIVQRCKPRRYGLALPQEGTSLGRRDRVQAAACGDDRLIACLLYTSRCV